MISILTWNVNISPCMAGNGSKDLLRAKSISDAIIEIDPDIVCLQEVFDDGMRDALVHYLSMTYGHIINKRDMPWSLKQDSGLFIASKYPVNSERFVPYMSSTGSDSLIRKGIISATIDVSGDIIYVLNTHLQENVKSVRESEIFRKKQVSRLAAVSSYQSYPTLVVGDMGISAENTDGKPSNEYLRMVKDLGMTDLYADEPGRHENTVSKSNENFDVDEDGCIDYIFASDDFALNRISTMRMHDLSDHFAVYAEVEV